MNLEKYFEEKLYFYINNAIGIVLFIEYQKSNFEMDDIINIG